MEAEAETPVKYFRDVVGLQGVKAEALIPAEHWESSLLYFYKVYFDHPSDNAAASPW